MEKTEEEVKEGDGFGTAASVAAPAGAAEVSGRDVEEAA